MIPALRWDFWPLARYFLDLAFPLAYWRTAHLLYPFSPLRHFTFSTSPCPQLTAIALSRACWAAEMCHRRSAWPFLGQQWYTLIHAYEGTTESQSHSYPWPTLTKHQRHLGYRFSSLYLSELIWTEFTSPGSRLGCISPCTLEPPWSRQWGNLPRAAVHFKRSWVSLCFFPLFTRNTLCKSNLPFASSRCATEGWWREGEGKGWEGGWGEEDGALFAISCSEEQSRNKIDDALWI